MKKLILIVIIILVSGTWSAKAQDAFYRESKHSTVKKMTRHQVRNAQKGKTLYVRTRGKVKKNR